MFSKRTKHSIAQYFWLYKSETVGILFEKHGIEPCFDLGPHSPASLVELAATIERASDEDLVEVLREVARTLRTLRNEINPKYEHDQRFEDLGSCLLLDGYRIEEGQLVTTDPALAEGPPIEDDLAKELGASGLAGANEVIRMFERSATAFRTGDCNGCLTKARIGLHKLAEDIAQSRRSKHPGNFDPAKWGSVIAYLGKTRFIDENEEKGLAGVYSFISPGAHQPLGLSDQEFARLGWIFAAGMCWFLVKRYQANR